MSSLFKPKPELIRIKGVTDQTCFFCGKESRDAIIGETDREIYLCLDHFRALCKKLRYFQ